MLLSLDIPLLDKSVFLNTYYRKQECSYRNRSIFYLTKAWRETKSSYQVKEVDHSQSEL